MPKLPRLTAEKAEKLLLDAGFIQIRSKGSHRIYRKEEIRVVISYVAYIYSNPPQPLIPENYTKLSLRFPRF